MMRPFFTAQRRDIIEGKGQISSFARSCRSRSSFRRHLGHTIELPKMKLHSNCMDLMWSSDSLHPFKPILSYKSENHLSLGEKPTTHSLCQHHGPYLDFPVVKLVGVPRNSLHQWDRKCATNSVASQYTPTSLFQTKKTKVNSRSRKRFTGSFIVLKVLLLFFTPVVFVQTKVVVDSGFLSLTIIKRIGLPPVIMNSGIAHSQNRHLTWWKTFRIYVFMYLPGTSVDFAVDSTIPHPSVTLY